MGFRTSRLMPEKRRENAVQKMLVLKQMMQVVEVHSPITGSMVDDSMPELRREAEALGADAVALAESYSSTSRQ